MTATYPNASNTYVPELTDKLVVDFSRNVNKFPLNRYVQIVPVEKQNGYYTKMTREEAGRILASDGKNFLWQDSMDRPLHVGETESHDFPAYGTKRRDFGCVIGYLGAQQAAFNVKAIHAGLKAEQAMRVRTQLCVTAATTTGNYDSAHTSAVASISGVSGLWDVSTTARKDIKRSLDYAVETILKSTLNGINGAEDLMLVMSPGCARKISVSQELVDHIKGSPDALAEIRGELPGRNVLFGLPNRLYGINVQVEDTAKVTSKKGGTIARSFILSDSTPFLCSRPGALVSERAAETASFSTLTLFMKEEMTTEEFDEPKHRRTELHVTEDYDVAVTASISGFLFTSAVS